MAVHYSTTVSLTQEERNEYRVNDPNAYTHLSGGDKFALIRILAQKTYAAADAARAEGKPVPSLKDIMRANMQ